MKSKLLLIVLLNLFFIFSINARFDIQEVKNEYLSLLEKKYILLPHEGSFLLPFSFSNKPNSSPYKPLEAQDNDKGDYNRNLEAEFQFSFMLLTARNIFNTDFNVFFAYTQQSWWQLYNDGWSRQFRETNYSPEVFIRKLFDTPISFLGGKVIAYDIGFIHQSNGQTQLLSRSWNRTYLRFAMVFGSTLIKTSLWYRIPDSAKTDSNRDIYKYLGYGAISVDYLFEKSRVEFKLIPGTKKQGAELGFSYPLREGIRFFTKIGYGYGLSMIDYNHRSEKVGIGVSMSDLLSN